MINRDDQPSCEQRVPFELPQCTQLTERSSAAPLFRPHPIEIRNSKDHSRLTSNSRIKIRFQYRRNVVTTEKQAFEAASITLWLHQYILMAEQRVIILH